MIGIGIGKEKCKYLREIRKRIAKENNIRLVTEECTYKGECTGTCPRCEAEVRYLESELDKRQKKGKIVTLVGLSLAGIACSSLLASCVPPGKADQKDYTIAEDIDSIGEGMDEGEVLPIDLSTNADSLDELGDTTLAPRACKTHVE